MLIREMGNCGNLDKLKRIDTAIKVAIRYDAEIAVVLDPLVYNNCKFKIKKVESYDFNSNDIIINGITIPWWGHSES